MSGVVGVTSGKFVLAAAALLFHGRIDNVPATIAIMPGASTSALGEALAAGHGAPPVRLKIGIRAEYFLGTVGAIEPQPAAGAALRIGRDLLDANPIEIDFPRHMVRLLLPGEAHRREAGMIAIPVTHDADGHLRVPLSVGGLHDAAAVLDLSRDTAISVPPTETGGVARIGQATMADIAVGAGDAPTIGLQAFIRSRVIFDLGHDRIWVVG